MRAILRAAVASEQPERDRLGSRIAARFSKDGLDEPIPELRGQPARPADFKR